MVRHLFNLSLSLEKVPALWKTSCVVPVPKEPDHFRPVALTSHLMETMERIILRHLRPLVGTQLDPLQFAYWPGIGVGDAVIYLLHRSLLHLEDSGNAVRVMFFDFSSAFNTIQPSLLRVNMENMGADQHLAAWTTDYLTNRPQFVRLHHGVSNVVLCSTGALQGTVLSPFLTHPSTPGTVLTTPPTANSRSSPMTQPLLDVFLKGNKLEYRMVIRDLISWCELNQLLLNTGKTEEMIINFRRKTSHFTPVNIQGLDIEVVESYKFLGVPLNNKLDWTDNSHALYKKGQSRLHLLRGLMSFGVCRALLRTFYGSVVASAILYAAVCRRGGSTDRDRSRLNRLIRRTSSVLD